MAAKPLPLTVKDAQDELAQLNAQISELERELILEDRDEPLPAEVDAKDGEELMGDWLPPPRSVPICADVRTFDFKARRPLQWSVIAHNRHVRCCNVRRRLGLPNSLSAVGSLMWS